MALSVCVPAVAVLVFQLTEYGAVVSSAPRDAPSSWNLTPATPTLSDASAVTVIVPVTVAPEAGELRLTVGAVVSGALFETVTATDADVVVLPAPSRATALELRLASAAGAGSPSTQ